MSAPASNGSIVLVTALLVGGFAGVVADRLFAEAPTPPPPPLTLPERRAYTPEELQIECLPYMRQTANTLEEAQTKVSALEIRIREKESEVRELEDQMEGAAKEGDDVATRLEEARAQLTTLESERQAAVAEKQQLLAALQQARQTLASTQMQLANSQAQLVGAREETLDSRWTSFVQDAQLRLCATGSSDRVGRCRESVAEALVPHKQRFKTCLRSDEAVPELRTAIATEDLPEAAAWLSRTDPEIRDWYLLFCDPELPEAGRGQPQPAPFPLFQPK